MEKLALGLHVGSVSSSLSQDVMLVVNGVEGECQILEASSNGCHWGAECEDECDEPTFSHNVGGPLMQRTPYAKDLAWHFGSGDILCYSNIIYALFKIELIY